MTKTNTQTQLIWQTGYNWVVKNCAESCLISLIHGDISHQNFNTTFCPLNTWQIEIKELY